MKIAVCGFMGVGSLGDEAGLQVLRSWFPTDEVSAFVREPRDSFSRQWGVTTWPKLEHATKADSIGRNLRGFNPGDDLAPVEETLDQLSRCDFLLLGPGAVFTEYSRDMLRGNMQELWLMSVLAQMVGTPYGIWAVSAAPILTPAMRYQAQDLIDRARFVIFRDPLSPRLLRSGLNLGLNQYVLPDPVFALSVPEAGPRDERHMVVSARSVSFAWSEGEYRSRMRRLIERWLADGGTAEFIVHYRGEGANDIEESLAIGRDLPVPVTIPTTPDDALRVYQRAGTVVATRMHAAAFAMLAGVPRICPIAYDPKVSGLMLATKGREAQYTPETIPESPDYFTAPWGLHLDRLPRYKQIIEEALCRT